jgi:bacteriocin-like protein
MSESELAQVTGGSGCFRLMLARWLSGGWGSWISTVEARKACGLSWF